MIGYSQIVSLTYIITSFETTTDWPSRSIQPLETLMPNPAWATAPSTTVALYTVKNKLHVKATSKPTQKCLTTLEENKAPEPHKTSGSNLQNIAMTAEEQEATIRLDLYNEDTMTNETGIQDTIGQKMPNLVKPWNEHLVHPAADLLEAYDTEGFQTNCGPY